MRKDKCNPCTRIRVKHARLVERMARVHRLSFRDMLHLVIALGLKALAGSQVRRD